MNKSIGYCRNIDAPSFKRYDEAVKSASHMLKQMKLDNSTSYHAESVLFKGDSLMKYKERVKVGNGEKWVSAATKHELHLAIAQVLLENGMLEPIEVSEPSIPTVQSFIREVYYPTYIANLAPKTVDTYRQYLKLNILPFLGHYRLDDVSVSTIQQFYNWMASGSAIGRKKDLNKRSIERIGGLTSRIFKVALEMRLIDDTPFKNTLLQIRAEPAGHHKALPDREIHRIKQEIATMENITERTFMALLAYTGMRLEEVLGLCWEDVHLDEHYCEITQTVTHPGNSQPHVRAGGKTLNSCRTVILPLPLINILQSCPNKQGFLIGGRKPLCWATYQRMRRKAFENLNIKGYSNHDFRTTFATQLCERGISAKEVADLMGHADTRMVETVYARRRHEGIMKHSAMINEMNSAYHCKTDL